MGVGTNSIFQTEWDIVWWKEFIALSLSIEGLKSNHWLFGLLGGHDALLDAALDLQKWIH